MDYAQMARKILDDHADNDKHPAIAEQFEEICAVMVGIYLADVLGKNTLASLNLKRVLADALLFMIGYRAGQESISEMPAAFKNEEDAA